MKKIWSVVGTIFVILFIIGALVTVFTIDAIITPKQVDPVEGTWVGIKEIRSEDYGIFPILYTIHFLADGTGYVEVADMALSDTIYVDQYSFTWKNTGNNAYSVHVYELGKGIIEVQVTLNGNFIDAGDMGSFKRHVETVSKENQSTIYDMLDMFAPYHQNYGRAYVVSSPNVENIKLFG